MMRSLQMADQIAYISFAVVISQRYTRIVNNQKRLLGGL